VNLVEVVKTAKLSRGLFCRFLDLMKNTECLTSVFFVALILRSLGSSFIFVLLRIQGSIRIATLRFGVPRHSMLWSVEQFQKEHVMPFYFCFGVVMHNNIQFKSTSANFCIALPTAYGFLSKL
jgi:hypothetical protein